VAILRQSSRESPSQRVKRPRSLLQSPSIPGKGLLARSFRAKGRTGGTCWKSRFAGTAATSNHGGLHAVRDPKRAEGRSVLHILNAGSLDTKREAYRKISQRRMSQASTKRGDCGPVVDQQTMRMAPNSRMTDSTSVSCRWAINPKSTPEAANAFSIIRWRYLSPILALRSLLVASCRSRSRLKERRSFCSFNPRETRVRSAFESATRNDCQCYGCLARSFKSTSMVWSVGRAVSGLPSTLIREANTACGQAARRR